MPNSKPTWKLDADQKRQATDPLRGYVYQAWQALHAWLELKNDQVLYLEGAEDFDIISHDSAVPVQVKDTSRSITLRNKSVTAAITNFWHLRKTHADKTISFTYLTRSTVGTEQGSPFGKQNKGLVMWQECQGDDDMIRQLAEFLSNDKTVAPKLPADLVRFLKQGNVYEIYGNLIYPMRWLTEAPPKEAVTDAIDRKLVAYGDRFDIPPSESSKVADRLLREILTVASLNEYSERQLDFARFARLFEKMTSIRIPKKHYKELQAIQNFETQLLEGLPQGKTLSFQPLTPILSPSSPPPLPPMVAQRQAIIHSFLPNLKQTGFLFISGSTGMGKTTLVQCKI